MTYRRTNGTDAPTTRKLTEKARNEAMTRHGSRTLGQTRTDLEIERNKR